MVCVVFICRVEAGNGSEHLYGLTSCRMRFLFKTKSYFLFFTVVVMAEFKSVRFLAET